MRVRLRFTKLGKVRWTSHRDVARMWERAFRRATLPVAWTGGFSPRPKVSFGLALPTGYESVAEYLDVALSEVDIDAAALPGRLTPALPVGVEVTAAAVIDDRAPSLQEDVASSSWWVEVPGVVPADLERLLDGALAAGAIPVTRERKGRQIVDDLRPAIVAAEVAGAVEGGAALVCELAARPRGARPSELLSVLGSGLDEGLVRRTHQWIERDGARWEPLPVATDAPHAGARAS